MPGNDEISNQRGKLKPTRTGALVVHEPERPSVERESPPPPAHRPTPDRPAPTREPPTPPVQPPPIQPPIPHPDSPPERKPEPRPTIPHRDVELPPMINNDDEVTEIAYLDGFLIFKNWKGCITHFVNPG